MSKVGLAIVTYVNNFGSFLQALATQEAIKKLGYETEVINIEGVQHIISKARKKYFLKRCFNPNELRSYAVTLKGIAKKKTDREYAKNISIRNAVFDAFRKDNFVYSPSISSWELIGQYCKDNYSSVLVGSDQLWRPANIEGNYYTLSYVPDEVNKIAYATSFGVPYLPKKQGEKAKYFIPRIQHLSVRENQGKKIIKDLTGLEAQVVCDPTMLITKEEWDKGVGTRLIEGDYILCYFLGGNQKYPKFARKLGDRLKIKTVGLVHCAGYNDNVEMYYDEMPFDIGPYEFINLIKHARLVLTDSFHCCVFSILFEKDFYAFKRFKDNDEMSTNDRLTTLFESMGIQNRILSGEEDLSSFDFDSINYEFVKEKIENIRKKSLEYLSNSLKE